MATVKDSDSLFKTYRSEKKSTADEATSLPGTSPTAAVAVAGSSTRSAIPSSSKPTTQSGCSPQVGNAESIVVNASKSKRNAAGVAVSSASAKQVTEGSAQSNSVKATSTDLRRVGEPTIKNSSSVSKTSVTEASAQSHKADAAPPQASHGQGGSKSDSTSAQAESIDSVTKGSIPQPGKSTSLIISPRQRGNPILKFIRNVPVEYGDIVADYQMGQTSCALFLSLKYHHLNPNYIHERLKQLGHTYDLRVVLVHADVKDPHHSLKELAKVCLLTDCTLILAFSPEEAGRYLETYKAYEKKPPDLIMERTDGNFMAKMTDCLTTVRRVNKTDVATLMTTFGSFERIVQADEEDLSFCPGFGPQKAKRLHSVLHEPFLKTKKIPLNTSPHKGIPSNSSEKKKTTTQLGQPS